MHNIRPYIVVLSFQTSWFYLGWPIKRQGETLRKLFPGTQCCTHVAVCVTHPHNCWYWLLRISYLCSLKTTLLKQLFQLTGCFQTVWCHLLLCSIFTNTITDGTPGGINGLVQAPLVVLCEQCEPNHFVAHEGGQFLQLVKRKCSFAKFVLPVEY